VAAAPIDAVCLQVFMFEGTTGEIERPNLGWYWSSGKRKQGAATRLGFGEIGDEPIRLSLCNRAGPVGSFPPGFGNILDASGSVSYGTSVFFLLFSVILLRYSFFFFSFSCYVVSFIFIFKIIFI
jgi:hypothetical protein